MAVDNLEGTETRLLIFEFLAERELEVSHYTIDVIKND